jgi:aspartate beta-hydroxylase
LKINKKSVGALYGKAKSLDTLADIEKNNKKLLEAISIYKNLLENYHDKMTVDMFKSIGERCIDRMRFLGQYERTLEVHELLMDRFREEPMHRNQLAVTYLLMNRLADAKFILHETLLKWRHDGFALVHYGFVLKNLDNDYEGAVMFLTEGIESNEPGTQDGRFYFTLGEALQRLGKKKEAMEVYKKGAALNLFPSEYQRSLYNIDRLKSRPFWTKAETTYKDHFTEISKYWEIIRDEGLKLLNEEGLFQDEHEKLMDKGNWKQLDLYTRGQKTKDCYKAPFTCKLLDSFKAAKCKRGQIKFSVIHPGTHVHPHCGPTNCRIRAHLGLKVPPNTFLRVVNETRSWIEGDWLIFDDSFEHEVWHNGTSIRLVLIVDVWHPDLTDIEKQEMSAI